MVIYKAKSEISKVVPSRLPFGGSFTELLSLELGTKMRVAEDPVGFFTEVEVLNGKHKGEYAFVHKDDLKNNCKLIKAGA